ncbi:MAG: GNAT family N-acetyltransferase [Pseudomonadota bacterium]|nr:GNAT family N-acetyltransferase [Pseudomonadota bacterium]
MPDCSIRQASHADAAALQPLIQRAYRGEASRAGWTHEADLIKGERMALGELEALIADPAERILIAARGARPIGCVRIAKAGDDLAYLGLLCVDPLLQAAGVGSALIAAGEAAARDIFGAARIEMTVIDTRAALIAYYERRGYVPAGTRDFPIALDPPLNMIVLEKALA